MTYCWPSNLRFQPQRVGEKLETSHFPWKRFLLRISELKTRTSDLLSQGQLGECTWIPGQRRLTDTACIWLQLNLSGKILLSVCGCCIAGPGLKLASEPQLRQFSQCESQLWSRAPLGVKEELSTTRSRFMLGQLSRYQAVGNQHSWSLLILSQQIWLGIIWVTLLGVPSMTHVPYLHSPPSVCHFASSGTKKRGRLHESAVGGAGAHWHTCPGSGSGLSPDLSWPLSGELSSIWEGN